MVFLLHCLDVLLPYVAPSFASFVPASHTVLGMIACTIVDDPVHKEGYKRYMCVSGYVLDTLCTVHRLRASSKAVAAATTDLVNIIACDKLWMTSYFREYSFCLARMPIPFQKKRDLGAIVVVDAQNGEFCFMESNLSLVLSHCVQLFNVGIHRGALRRSTDAVRILQGHGSHVSSKPEARDVVAAYKNLAVLEMTQQLMYMLPHNKPAYFVHGKHLSLWRLALWCYVQALSEFQDISEILASMHAEDRDLFFVQMAPSEECVRLIGATIGKYKRLERWYCFICPEHIFDSHASCQQCGCKIPYSELSLQMHNVDIPGIKLFRRKAGNRHSLVNRWQIVFNRYDVYSDLAAALLPDVSVSLMCQWADMMTQICRSYLQAQEASPVPEWTQRTLQIFGDKSYSVSECMQKGLQVFGENLSSVINLRVIWYCAVRNGMEIPVFVNMLQTFVEYKQQNAQQSKQILDLQSENRRLREQCAFESTRKRLKTV